MLHNKSVESFSHQQHIGCSRTILSELKSNVISVQTEHFPPPTHDWINYSLYHNTAFRFTYIVNRRNFSLLHPLGIPSGRSQAGPQSPQRRILPRCAHPPPPPPLSLQAARISRGFILSLHLYRSPVSKGSKETMLSSLTGYCEGLSSTALSLRWS